MTRPERDYWPTDDWRTAAPEEHGLDGAVLASIREFGARTEPPATGLLVVRHGYVVCEEYFNGAGPGTSNNINSATKSVTSALIGIAQRDGLLGDLDEPVVGLFPEIEVDDERKRRISLRHLLTMTSGFVDLDRPDLERMLRVDDPVRFIWQRPMACEPGRRFSYDDAALQLLSIILSRVTGTSAAEYAKRELFEPLGIWPDNARARWRIAAKPAAVVPPFGASWPPIGLRWVSDRVGHNMAGAGLHLTPREMAKFGWLYLNRGAWDGRQIIPEAWVADSTREHSRGDFHLHPAGREMSYGYLWWIDQLAPGSFTANGFGGQLIIVIPQQDMVVVTATSPRPQIAAAIRRFVLPAIRE